MPLPRAGTARGSRARGPPARGTGSSRGKARASGSAPSGTVHLMRLFRVYSIESKLIVLPSRRRLGGDALAAALEGFPLLQGVEDLAGGAALVLADDAIL